LKINIFELKRIFKRRSISAFPLTQIFSTLSVSLQDTIMDCVAQVYNSADADLTLANIRHCCNIDNISEKEIEIKKLSPTLEISPYSLTVVGNRPKNQGQILNLPMTFRCPSD
jgi:hypothetical protein